jgi:genome maintenance exonuclease 1
MHTFLEHYIKNGKLSERPPNPYSWASHAMAEVVIADGLKNLHEMWGIEVSLFYPELYAGTADGVGVHLSEESMFDYKQTNKPKKEEWIDDYYLQLVAYALAHNRVYGTNIRKGVIMMCIKPEMDASMKIITPPKYQEFVLKPQDFNKWEDKWWERLELYYKLE